MPKKVEYKEGYGINLGDIKPIRDRVFTRENKTRGLGYTELFKKLVKENPGLISALLKLDDELKIEGQSFEENGLKARLILKKSSCDFYELAAGGTKLFVKVDHRSNNGGYSEFVSSKQLRDRPELEDVPWVEVLDYYLGYTKGNKKIFISRWRDLVILKEYLYNRDCPIDPAEREDLENKIAYLKSRFMGQFADFNEHNMFYDPQSRKIIIFDIELRKH